MPEVKKFVVLHYSYFLDLGMGFRRLRTLLLLLLLLLFLLLAFFLLSDFQCTKTFFIWQPTVIKLRLVTTFTIFFTVSKLIINQQNNENRQVATVGE